MASYDWFKRNPRAETEKSLVASFKTKYASTMCLTLLFLGFYPGTKEEHTSKDLNMRAHRSVLGSPSWNSPTSLRKSMGKQLPSTHAVD